MKNLLTLLGCLCLFLFLVPLSGYGQGCSGQFTLQYPSGSGTASNDYNNGSGPTAITYCPNGSSVVNITITTGSEGTFTFTGPNQFSQSYTFTNLGNGSGSHTFPLPSTGTSSSFALNATFTCGQKVVSNYTISLAPSLTISSNNASTTSAGGHICPNTPVTITAGGGVASGSTPVSYSLYVNGATTNPQTRADGIFTVIPASSNTAPTTTTTYTVTTNTLTCSNAAQSISYTVDNGRLSPSASPATTSTTGVAPNTTVTLTAAGGNSGGSYTWTERTSSTGAATTTAGQTSYTLTRNPPRTTVYTVRGPTALAGCTSTGTVTVFVTGFPLPVELISFEAVWVNKVASITWTTASEKNSAYFAAERSFDGSTFNTVGVLAGAGTTSITTNYRFNDISLNTMAVPKVYYRLQQVDISGEVSYSPVRVLQVAAAGNTFQASVFPNPYTNTAAVQFHSSGDNIVKLTLHNVLGQNIFTKLVTAAAGVQEVALPLSATLPFGVYYLTIHQGNKQQVVRINH